MPDELSPAQALQLAKAVADTYGQAADRLLAAIARAAAKGIDSPRWAESALANTIGLRDQARRILDKATTDGQSTTMEALREAYDGGRAAPTTGLVGVHARAVEALAADTVRITTSVGPQLLRWADDVYRQVVADTVGASVAGAQTRRDAAAAALDRFAAQGVGRFVDSVGRNWHLESYTEMAVRTAVGRAHLAGTVARFDADGREWVIVSDSPEECPQCRPFEGKVLSLHGDQPPPDLGGLSYAGTLDAARTAGLFHPNCTHRAGAFVPGLTKPFPTDTDNPDGYQARQRQRELERRVRESKRRVAAVDPLGDTATLTRQKQLLTARRRALGDFVEENGRKAHVSGRRTSTRRL